MPGVGTRDSFKTELRRKSRTEMFADLLEQLFKVIKDLGIDPIAVVEEVQLRGAGAKKITKRQAEQTLWPRNIDSLVQRELNKNEKGVLTTERRRPNRTVTGR